MNKLKQAKNYCICLALMTCFIIYKGNSQIMISPGISTSVDYFTSSEFPKYLGSGSSKQINIRNGIFLRFDFSKKLSAGFGVETYRRDESFDCIYFPSANDSLPTLTPLVNNAEYGCGSTSNATTSFLEVPIFVEYRFYYRNNLVIYSSIGIGPQIVFNRSVVITDNASQVAEDINLPASETSFINSWTKPRFSTGIRSKLIDRVLFDIFTEFRTDRIDFINNTYSLGLKISYSLIQ